MNNVKKKIQKIYFINGKTTEITNQTPKIIITEEYDPQENITLYRIEKLIDGKFLPSPQKAKFMKINTIYGTNYLM